MADVENEFKSLIENAIKETGKDLSVTPAVGAALMREATARLQPAAGTAGFYEAVDRETKALAIRMGIQVVDVADRVDARWWGIVSGSLAIAAAAL